MGWLAFAMLYLVVLAGAIKQIRDNRRRGVGIDWTRTLVTAGGAILITVLATGGLIGAMALGEPAIGLVVFVLVVVAGLIALAVAVNRRWPPAKAR